MSKETEPDAMSKLHLRDFFFSNWRPTLLVLICSLLFFGSLGAPFYDKQEPREALVVWEINHSGNWFLPLRNGYEIPSEPPLYHWLAAIVSQSPHHLNEITARFPSALLGVFPPLHKSPPCTFFPLILRKRFSSALGGTIQAKTERRRCNWLVRFAVYL